MIFLLVFFFLVLTIVTYKLFKGEIANPAFIYSYTYLLSSICTLCNIREWNVHLSVQTFLILFVGSIEFVLITWLINVYFSKKYKVETKNNEVHKINNKFMIFIIVYAVVIIILTIYYVFKIAGQFGEYSSLTQAQALFKTHTSYSNDTSLPHYLSLMYKVLELSSYYCIIFYMKEIIYSSKGNIRKNALKKIYYIIPPILYCVKELICSSRISIMQMALGAVTIAIIIWSQKESWNKKVSLKVISVICCIGVAGLILFYLSASIIGRSNKKNVFQYITTYAGGSIECLDHYVRFPNEDEKSDIIGNETFYCLIQSLDKYKITHTDIAQKQTAHLSFRYYYDSMIGNVYTAYRRWHHDFGWVGIILLNGFMSACFAIGYYIQKYKANMKFNEVFMAIYMYLSYCLYMHCIDSYFYTSVFQITFVTNVIVFVALYYIFYKLNFRSLFGKNKIYLDENKKE